MKCRIFKENKLVIASHNQGKIKEIRELLTTDLPIYAIDVNSKFEIIPGKKKIKELSQFKRKLYEL